MYRNGTISDESLLSPYHLMKSLLHQAAGGKVITKERCRHVRRARTPGPGQQSSSEGESSEGECTNGSYTSDAINSDDDLGSLDFLVAHDRPPLSPSIRPRPQQVKTTTTIMPTSPGSGYSAEDYAPLGNKILRKQDLRKQDLSKAVAEASKSDRTSREGHEGDLF